jgi:hypothetical protein
MVSLCDSLSGSRVPRGTKTLFIFNLSIICALLLCSVQSSSGAHAYAPVSPEGAEATLSPRFEQTKLTTSPAAQSAAKSAAKSPTAKPAAVAMTITAYKNANVVGHDMKGSPWILPDANAPPDMCFAMCESNLYCKAWVWEPASVSSTYGEKAPRCYLKTNLTDDTKYVPAMGRILGFRQKLMSEDALSGATKDLAKVNGNNTVDISAKNFDLRSATAALNYRNVSFNNSIMAVRQYSVRFIRQIMNAVNKYDTLSTKMMWSDALQYCEKRSQRLCELQDYCPSGRGADPASGMQLGDYWAPISDGNNEWVYIGNNRKHICATYGELYRVSPGWGKQQVSKSFKGPVMCCNMKLTPMPTAKPSWRDAFTYCQARNKRLCSRAEYCPAGEQHAPFGGMLFQAEWAPVFDNQNEWVSIGSRFPRRLSCKLHSKLAHRTPYWGLSSGITGPTRGIVKCCEDSFYNFEGSMTYDAAKSFCAEKNRVLCTRNEYCPNGVGSMPRGGPRPGIAWAPVNDSSNEWIAVGFEQKNQWCQKHTVINKEKPKWGTDSDSAARVGIKGYVQCCVPKFQSAEDIMPGSIRAVRVALNPQEHIRSRIAHDKIIHDIQDSRRALERELHAAHPELGPGTDGEHFDKATRDQREDHRAKREQEQRERMDLIRATQARERLKHEQYMEKLMEARREKQGNEEAVKHGDEAAHKAKAARINADIRAAQEESVKNAVNQPPKPQDVDPATAKARAARTQAVYRQIMDKQAKLDQEHADAIRAVAQKTEPVADNPGVSTAYENSQDLAKESVPIPGIPSSAPESKDGEKPKKLVKYESAT